MHLEPIFIPCYLFLLEREESLLVHILLLRLCACAIKFIFVCSIPFFLINRPFSNTVSHILSYVLSNTQRKRGRRIIWHLIPSRFSLALSVLLKYIYVVVHAPCYLALFVSFLYSLQKYSSVCVSFVPV